MINHDLEKIKKEIRNNKNNNKKNSSFFLCFLNRFLITSLITVITLIVLKKNPNFKQNFYKAVYEDNFNFAFINRIYDKYLGGTVPFSNLFNNETAMVFNETLKYNDSTNYLDGVSLNVGTDYLVPVLDNGLVVFIGEKEGYGNTIIVQQTNGIDVWYSNIGNVNVKLYDYVSKGELIGDCHENLYLVFKKDGNVLDYKEYIQG